MPMPLPVCKECRYAKKDFAGGWQYATCMHKKAIYRIDETQTMLTGKKPKVCNFLCHSMRVGVECDREGKLWEPRDLSKFQTFCRRFLDIFELKS